MSKLTPHKHHDIIVKWAQGYPIQYRPSPDEDWSDFVPSHSYPSPSWTSANAYRVKPKPVIVKYRVLFWNHCGEPTVSSSYYQTLEDYNERNKSHPGIQLLESLSIEVEGEYK